MESNPDFDINRVTEACEALAQLRQELINNYNKWVKKQESKDAPESTFIEIRYIGKIKIKQEQGKEVELDAFMSVEQIGNKFQYAFYAQEANGNIIYLGIKREEKLVDIEENLVGLGEDSKAKLRMDLEKKWNEREEAITLKELQEKQAEQEGETTQETASEAPVLPGVDEHETILTKAQMDSLDGPQTRQEQMINGRTLGNTIGISGMYIKFVDARKAEEMCPGLEIEPGQIYVPFNIKEDGTGTPIGPDKMSFSRLEGTNYSGENTTITNNGKVSKEQNIQTFNIHALGEMSASISIGYDENDAGMNQQEIKFEFRNPENPKQKVSVELESAHNDFGQAYGTHQYIQETGEGSGKGANTVERADTTNEPIVENVDADPNNNTIPEEYVRRYAKEMNIDDLEVARRCLEKAMRYNPEASFEEILEAEQHIMGPETPGSHY